LTAGKQQGRKRPGCRPGEENETLHGWVARWRKICPPSSPTRPFSQGGDPCNAVRNLALRARIGQGAHESGRGPRPTARKQKKRERAEARSLL
jgi:hypothetical protein